MPQTSMQIRRQIQKLERQADMLARREAGEVLARIRQAVTYYKFGPEDLFGTPAKRARRPAAPKPVRAPAKSPAKRKIAVKYRDAAGNTWTGRGSTPRWLVAALANGKSIADFAV